MERIRKSITARAVFKYRGWLTNEMLAIVVIEQREAEPHFLQRDDYKTPACFSCKRKKWKKKMQGTSVRNSECGMECFESWNEVITE